LFCFGKILFAIIRKDGGVPMAYKRYIIEIGKGMDMHGGDVTNAACKAVKDAISSSCLAGLKDIAGITDPNMMHVKVKIACPHPENVKQEEVLAMVPFGSKEIELVEGGLSVQGLFLPFIAEGDTIVVALAALTVYVDV
jgi:uncharacterized protein (TIGR02058 family)